MIDTTAAADQVEQFEPYTWRLTQEALDATFAKIEKINARAAKRGFTGRLEVISERKTSVETTPLGFKIEHVYFETRVSGEAPSYNGFKFLAKVEWNDKTPIVQTAPGVEGALVDRSVLVPGHCAHCNVNRYRKNTFIVRGEDGRDVQIGSTCIKDFLGWSATPAFISEASVNEEIEEGLGGYGAWDGPGGAYTPETVLAHAWAAIRAHGFVRASDYNSKGTPTGQLVKYALGYDRLPKHQGGFRGCGHCDLVAEIDALDPKGSEEEAAKILAFLRSDEFSGASEYVQNLKALVAAETVNGKFINLLASGPQAFARHQEKTLIRERRAAQPSEFIGQEKDKIEFEGEIISIRFIEGDYGTTVLYTLRAENGNVVKWFASREALGDATGRTVKIKGTVKKHEEYNGLKSTVLTRCKEIEN